MTHELYRAKAKNIDIQIAHLHEERKQLKFEYTEQSRILNKGQVVTYDGLNWIFTGNCEIDNDTGIVLYEIDNGGYVVYRVFEDLEVCE